MFGALLVAKERKSAPKLAKLGWGLSGGLIAGVLLFLKDAISFINGFEIGEGLAFSLCG